MNQTSLINEYISKRYSALDLQNELQNLICKYNELKHTYLFVYAVDFDKMRIPGLDLSLSSSDYHFIHEMLRKIDSKNLDFYLETPGGSGTAAEDIVSFLHNKFDTVNFLIAGEAKSAGTIMAMAADEIYMTDSGSLGPIDAQMRIGRSVVSAFDYINWINDKRSEVSKGIPLSPVDATMIAQISPGELEGAVNALSFATDKLKEWLPKYKFKNWKETETSKTPVTEEMKMTRANEIATAMANHKRWRDHGKSLKIADLEGLGLKINRVEDDEKLEDIVYRIKIVIMLMFASSNHYKIYQTADEQLYSDINISQPARQVPPVSPVHFGGIICPQCKRNIQIYAKLAPIPAQAEEELKRQFIPFPSDNKLKCECGCSIDVSGVRNQIEHQAGKKIIE